MNESLVCMAKKPENLLSTRYSLLSRLQNWDDQESWKDFFNTYWRLIYSVAAKAGLNQQEAEDVVQDTVICVAKDIDKFRRDRALGSFKGWLRNITHWRIADQLRKRMPNPTGEKTCADPALEEISDPHIDSLEAAWEEEWQQSLFDAAADRVKRQVKEEHYQMFDLYVVKKWPVGKVAKTLAVSAGRVYLAKHRVAALIKKEIQRLERKGI